MRRNLHLITNDVVRYMAEYEVRRFVLRAFFFARRPTLLLAGQRGPRCNWPTRAFVGGLVLCMGSRWRVSIFTHTLCPFHPTTPARPG